MAISELSIVKLPPPETPSGGPDFPIKTALVIAVVAGTLAIWQAKVDNRKGLAPETFKEAFALHRPVPPAPPVAVKAPTHNVQLPPPSPLFVDDTNELDPFFAALWKLEQGNQGVVVTILHYGDSPTTADLITGDSRARLQARFGDAGRGYTLIGRPWAWYGHRGVEMSDHGWVIHTGVGLMREGIYGLGGAAFEGQPGAWSKFRLTESPQSTADIEYLARPGGGSFAIAADDTQISDQTTAADTQVAAFLHVDLPAGTKVVSLRVTSGAVILFGADFRRGSRGLLYDSLGLNGATTSVLARVLKEDIWAEELVHAGPALVIVNYGSNESGFGKFVHTQYADELRIAIGRIRHAIPGVPILIMSPMDRGERTGLDDIETMSTIPEIISIQRNVAAETHCAFFDTFDAMGASGTMARWYAASPRLVSADLLHPSPQGAAIVANLFVDQLELRYDRWKMRQAIAIPPSAAAHPLNPAIRKGKPLTHHPAYRDGKKAKVQ